MLFRKSVYIAFLFCGSLVSREVFAQLEMSVVDETGASLPSAHVTFTDPSNGKQQTVLSDANGQIKLLVTGISENRPLPLKISFLGYHDVRDTLRSMDARSYHLEPDKIALNNIVITGEYSPNNPERSVNRVRIIDRKQLDAMGAVNVADAIKYENNIRMGRDNVLGSSASVQGISGQNVKIMIDGVPVIGRQDGNIDLAQLNLNNVERVEIIQGPLSVSYGSNALAGTINIITKKNQENTYSAGLNTYYESVGQYNTDAQLGFSKGKHFVGVTAGRNFFDGWNPGEKAFQLPQSAPADSNRYLQWNPKEQLFGGFQYKYTAKHLTIRPHADGFRETITVRGQPRAPYYDKAFDQQYTTDRINYGIDLGGDFGNQWQWKAIASVNDYERVKKTVYKDLTTLEEELTANAEDQDTTDFHSWMSRGSVIWGRNEQKLRAELGYDVNQENITGKRIEDKKQTMGDYAAFASVEYQPINNLLLKPGVRYGYNTKYNAPVVPAVNIRYVLGSTTLRFSYARGFRAPSLKELYFEFVDFNHNLTGNDALKAESSDNFQMEVSKSFVYGQVVTKIEANGFYNNIHDLITLAQNGGGATSYSYINVGEYTTQGVQLTLSHAVNHVHMSVGMAWTGRMNKFDDTLAATPMVYSPEANARIQYEFKKLDGNLALFAKYNGKLQTYQVNDAGEIHTVQSGDYTIVDLTATKYLFKKRLNWTFGVKNLLDVQSVNQTGSVAGAHSGGSGGLPVSWGRTFFTSLKFNISWK